MVRAHRIVYGLGLAQMWRLPELDEMVRSASGLSDADSAILLDEENVPTANSSRQQIGAYMRALGSLVSCLPDEHATAQSNGLLSLATIIDSVVFEALDTFEVLDPPVNNHREEFKHERRTQVQATSNCSLRVCMRNVVDCPLIAKRAEDSACVQFVPSKVPLVEPRTPSN